MTGLHTLSFIFVAKPHSPIALPESVLWRVESLRAPDISILRGRQALYRAPYAINVSTRESVEFGLRLSRPNDTPSHGQFSPV